MSSGMTRQDLLRTALEIIDRAAAIHRCARSRRANLWRREIPAALGDRKTALIAEIFPFLRGQISINQSFCRHGQDDEKMLRFTSSYDGPQLAPLGTQCPDHFLRTKIKPLFVEWKPQSPRHRSA